MVLCLKKGELLFDAVTRLVDRELERLARLRWTLERRQQQRKREKKKKQINGDSVKRRRGWQGHERKFYVRSSLDRAVL